MEYPSVRDRAPDNNFMFFNERSAATIEWTTTTSEVQCKKLSSVILSLNTLSAPGDRPTDNGPRSLYAG